MASVSARRRWWALLSLLFGLLVVGLDITILNVALPTLAVDLVGAVFLVCAVLAVVVACSAGPRFPKRPGASEAQSQHEPSRVA